MIRFLQGNLFDAPVEALVNTVNTVGVMGKGIALMFKEAFPENFRAYEAAVKRDELQPRVRPVFVPEDLLKINLPALVENAISKWHETRLENFRSSLADDCGDQIAAEMDFRGLRCLHGNEPWFSDEATAE